MEALAFDPSKCSKLSMEQKRELVYEMSTWPEGASEMLQSWSRQDILQILCAELGKDRKFTGLTKTKIIENLLKVVYEKKSQEPIENGERSSKRQRKYDHPNHLQVSANGVAAISPHVDSGNAVYCKNSACKAKMNEGDVFCKRCSCCICRQYDDNKDPSLWLICISDPPFRGASCGMSCHLECALRQERCGISQDRELDGSFYCVFCGKVNDLLSCWRKQVLVGRDTRRVDILGYRLSLSQKILAGTKQYHNLYTIIDEAVKMLEQDVGPLTGLPVKKARGIVNRLSSGPKIQSLCASALDSLDLMLSNRVPDDIPSGCSKLVTLEDIRATSLMVIVNSNDSNMGESVGYSLWHKKADDSDYPADPAHRLLKPNTKFLLSGLIPCTHYFLKVVSLNSGFCELQFQTGTCQDIITPRIVGSPATICSSLSNPSSVEDGHENSPGKTNSSDQTTTTTGGDVISDAPLIDCNKESPTAEDTSTDNGSNTPRTGLECVPYEAAGLPITPCKFENAKDDNRPKFSGNGDEEPQAGSSSKKRSGETRDDDDKCSGIGDKDFEYYVKVIRWLECDGHIETSFRQKFLTWYSLRAGPQEVRIVKVFIDTFVEDPESLADQLVDSFSDVISNKRCCRVPAGFCTKLWH